MPSRLGAPPWEPRRSPCVETGRQAPVEALAELGRVQVLGQLEIEQLDLASVADREAAAEGDAGPG